MKKSPDNLPGQPSVLSVCITKLQPENKQTASAAMQIEVLTIDSESVVVLPFYPNQH